SPSRIARSGRRASDGRAAARAVSRSPFAGVASFPAEMAVTESLINAGEVSSFQAGAPRFACETLRFRGVRLRVSGIVRGRMVLALLFFVALVAGALNSVAGGGSFLSFPTLLFAGVPPISANATNTVALWPG